jgi:hypothetical protein
MMKVLSIQRVTLFNLFIFGPNLYTYLDHVYLTLIYFFLTKKWTLIYFNAVQMNLILPLLKLWDLSDLLKSCDLLKSWTKQSLKMYLNQLFYIKKIETHKHLGIIFLYVFILQNCCITLSNQIFF